MSKNFLLGLLLIWKSKIWIAALWMVVVSIAGVFMASEFSGRQPATVGLDVGISVLKLVLPVLTALVVQEVLSKDLERRFYLYSFSYPNSRIQVLLGRLAAISFVSVLQVLLIAISVSLAVNVVSLSYEQTSPVSLGINYWLVICFILFDVLSVVCVAVLLATVSNTLGFVLIGTLGFTLVARSFSGIIDLLSGPAAVVDNQGVYEGSINVLGFILPDLGSLDIRTIALYNNLSLLPEGWLFLLVSVVFHMVVIVGLSALIFSNRRFG